MTGSGTRSHTQKCYLYGGETLVTIDQRLSHNLYKCCGCLLEVSVQDQLLTIECLIAVSQLSPSWAIHIGFLPLMPAVVACWLATPHLTRKRPRSGRRVAEVRSAVTHVPLRGSSLQYAQELLKEHHLGSDSPGTDGKVQGLALLSKPPRTVPG